MYYYALQPLPFCDYATRHAHCVSLMFYEVIEFQCSNLIRNVIIDKDSLKCKYFDVFTTNTIYKTHIISSHIWNTVETFKFGGRGVQCSWIVGSLLIHGDTLVSWIWVFSFSKKTNSFEICFCQGCRFAGEGYSRKIKPPRILIIPQYVFTQWHTKFSPLFYMFSGNGRVNYPFSLRRLHHS